MLPTTDANTMPANASVDAKQIEVLLSNTPQKSNNRTRNYIIAAVVAIVVIAASILTYNSLRSKPSSTGISALSKYANDCPENAYYDSNNYKCSCNGGYYWDIYSDTCKKIAPSGQPWPCPLNAYFDWSGYNCVCDDKYWWDGRACQPSGQSQPVVPSCGSDSTFNWDQYKCVCNSGFHYDNGCKADAVTTGCQDGYTWNGWQCEYNKAKSCPQNAHFDWSSDSCTCDVGFSWSSNSCQSTFTQTQEASSAGTGSHWGSLTNYDPSTGPGYCTQRVHSNSEFVVAIQTDQLFAYDLCNKFITIYGNGRSVRVQVVDQCAKSDGCIDGTVDAVLAVWNALGMTPGRQDITWSM